MLAQVASPSSAMLKLRAAAADIKLAHSVFALPFAVLAAFVARPEAEPWSRFGTDLGLVVACMVFARTWAMLVNRWADRGFDAANPRTARRAVPSGRLTAGQTLAIAGGSAACFIGATAVFWVVDGNVWPLALSAPVLAWIAFYSFTKRFTALCHVFLGGALAASPIAAAIAVNPGAVWGAEGVRRTAVLLFAGMVLLWVAGFDVIYGLQDVEFDRRAGLSSIPARLGARRAIWVSRLLHAGAFVVLCLAARADERFGPVFAGAVLAVGGLLVTEHAILAKRGQAGLDMAFFTVNGVVSCVLGVAGVVDLVAV